MAFLSVVMQWRWFAFVPPWWPILPPSQSFGLYCRKLPNSAAGIPVIFAFTGLLGFGLGPLLSYYLAVNPSIVMTALGGTGVIFLGLSGYALSTRKDFSFLGRICHSSACW